jgi:hypothetical protein
MQEYALARLVQSHSGDKKMVRSIVAVVVGYLVLAVGIFVGFSLLYLILGADGSFQAGSYKVSTTWVAVSS